MKEKETLMANSKYEYVKAFEHTDNLLPHTWIVIRVDGRAFTRFTHIHDFKKPNDMQALLLMNECAKAVLDDIPDIIFAYGASDEYSFVLRKTSTLYQRRASKLISIIVSLFSASYVMNWSRFCPGKELQYAPTFDGRAVCYPSEFILRDYLAWRQVDCHVNNQYNTCFWKLVESGMSNFEAQNELKGTTTDVKNELLFTNFNMNYSELPLIFRKGSIVFRKKDNSVCTCQREERTESEKGDNTTITNNKPYVVLVEEVAKVENGEAVKRSRTRIVVEHEDIIRDNFWTAHPYILSVENKQRSVLQRTITPTNPLPRPQT